MTTLEELMKPFIEDKQISCEQCFVVAQESETKLKKLKEFCDLHKVKIRSCQLGCFE